MGDFSVGCRCFTTTPCPWATHDAATSAATIVNSFSVFMYFPLEPALDRTLGFRHISSRTKERMDREVGERRTGNPRRSRYRRMDLPGRDRRKLRFRLS